jgi:cell wall-associated NlpC family hydrolase
MPSQALAFGELLAGGVLLTMGVSGKGVRDVLTGKAGHVGPIATAAPAGGAAAQTTSFSPGSGVEGATPSAQRFVKLAESQQGVREGTAREAAYARAAGISPAEAWCAAFVTWAVKRAGLTPPASPGATESWEHWSGGENIGTDLAKARPGDLLTFSGEHIGIYIGNGRMISGNWGNQVGFGKASEGPAPLSGIIRIKGFYLAAAKRAVRHFGRQLQVA